jgi:hypothetical protein
MLLYLIIKIIRHSKNLSNVTSFIPFEALFIPLNAIILNINNQIILLRFNIIVFNNINDT